MNMNKVRLWEVSFFESPLKYVIQAFAVTEAIRKGLLKINKDEQKKFDERWIKSVSLIAQED